MGLAGENGIDTGPLLYWEPGTPLPEVRLRHHVPRWPTRLAQRAVHPLLLPVLDRRRPAFDPSYRPVSIPGPVNDRLSEVVEFGEADTTSVDD